MSAVLEIRAPETPAANPQHIYNESGPDVKSGDVERTLMPDAADKAASKW
ncbi:hypothetical protein [Nocardia anaemiae]|nr:hypothetical protein [Nocardia anaemiae]